MLEVSGVWGCEVGWKRAAGVENGQMVWPIGGYKVWQI